MKYEYKIIPIQYGHDICVRLDDGEEFKSHNPEDILNWMGKRGWKFVRISSTHITFEKCEQTN